MPIDAMLYDKVGWPPWHSVPLHVYLLKDTLTGCIKFGFARWHCSAHDVQKIVALLESNILK